jgi:hypothetical protein
MIKEEKCRGSDRISLRSAFGSGTTVYTSLINTFDEVSAMYEHEYEMGTQNCGLTVASEISASPGKLRLGNPPFFFTDVNWDI